MPKSILQFVDRLAGGHFAKPSGNRSIQVVVGPLSRCVDEQLLEFGRGCAVSGGGGALMGLRSTRCRSDASLHNGASEVGNRVRGDAEGCRNGDDEILVGGLEHRELQFQESRLQGRVVPGLSCMEAIA